MNVSLNVHSAPSCRFWFTNICKSDYLSFIPLLTVCAESKCVCLHVNTNGLKYEWCTKTIVFYKESFYLHVRYWDDLMFLNCKFHWKSLLKHMIHVSGPGVFFQVCLSCWTLKCIFKLRNTAQYGIRTRCRSSWSIIYYFFKQWEKSQ